MIESVDIVPRMMLGNRRCNEILGSTDSFFQCQTAGQPCRDGRRVRATGAMGRNPAGEWRGEFDHVALDKEQIDCRVARQMTTF